MKKKYIYKLLYLTVIFYLNNYCLSFAQSPQPIGTITSIEGVADIQGSNKDASFLKDSDQVYLSDRIRTKSYSKVEVTFLDKSVLRLAPNTCVTIDKYSLDNNNRRDNAVIKLSRGEVEAVVSKTGKPETFHIETPNASAKVKGSDIFVFYQGGRTGALVKDGLMSLSNTIAPENRVELGEGDFSSVAFKDSPITSRPYLDADLLRHKKEVLPILTKKWVSYKGVSTMTASVVIATGTVMVYKKLSKDYRPVKKGELLTEDDRLQTLDDGLAEIRLGNGNSLLLNYNTELLFRKMEYDPKTGAYNNTFESTKGKIKAVIDKLGKDSTFQVKTPTALCGARGTVMMLDISSSSTQAFYEGGGGIVTSTITGNTQNVEPGQNCASDSQGAISSPVYTSTEQKLSNDQSFGSGDMAQGLSGLAEASNTQDSQITSPTMGEAVTSANTVDSALTDTIDATTPPFEQVARSATESTPGVFYDTVLTGTSFSSPEFDYPTIKVDLSIKEGGTWTANISSTIVSPLSASIGYNIQTSNVAGDNFNMMLTTGSTGNTWVMDGLSSTIVGKGSTMTLLGTSGSGEYSTTTLVGSAHGTWT